MKVAHFLNFSPHRAGIYGTAIDMIMAERKVGIDAQAIDYGNGLESPQRYSRVGYKDGGVVSMPPEWAVKEADIIVRHSALPQAVYDVHKPIIMALHGAVEYSFMLEHMGATRTLKEVIVSAQNPDYKMFVTFWKQCVFPWQTLLCDKKICYVPAMVDLDFYNPGGNLYKFEKPGTFNVVVTNIWRKEYETPYDVLFAASKWVKEKCPSARVHVFAVPADNLKYPKNDGPVNRTLLALQKSGCVGECHHLVPNLQDVYRSADMLVTPHVLASRTIREALACGCPVVAATGCEFTPYTAHPKDIDGYAHAINRCYKDIQKDKKAVRDSSRNMAVRSFSLEDSGLRMKELFNEVLTCRNQTVS